MREPKQFRKKPVIITAIQWSGSYEDAVILNQWSGGNLSFRQSVFGNRLDVRTFEGIVTACPNDWIIRGVAGEYYPCKPDIFSVTYELVERENDE